MGSCGRVFPLVLLFAVFDLFSSLSATVFDSTEARILSNCPFWFPTTFLPTRLALTLSPTLPPTLSPTLVPTRSPSHPLIRSHHPHTPVTQFLPLSDPLWVQSLGAAGYRELQHYWGKVAPEDVPLLPMVARLKGSVGTAHSRRGNRGGGGQGEGGEGEGTKGEGEGGGQGGEKGEGAKGRGRKGGVDRGGHGDLPFRPFTPNDCAVPGVVG